MRRGARFGIAAMVLGSIAIVFVIGAHHAESLRGITSAFLLTWLDARGFVGSPQTGSVAELRSPGIFFFADKGAIYWLLVHSAWLSVWAMLLALWAEFKLEGTLYLSAGFILGALALVLLSFPVGILAMGIGATVVVTLRRRRNA